MDNSDSPATMFASPPTPPPSSRGWTPHEYQLKGVRHLLERHGAGLLLDPGLGKTSTVLAALSVLFQDDPAPALVLAPLRVAQLVWPVEAQKWSDFHHLRVVVLHGKDKRELLDQPADLYVLNYEGIDWFLEADGIHRTGVRKLICDESTRLKNSQGKRFKALRAHLNEFKTRWILTGTPAPNGLIDLWAQVFIVDGGLALGRYITHFRTSYYEPPPPGGYDWVIRKGSAETIYEKVKPYMLRMAAEDYLELPELITNDITVEMPPAARKVYDDLYEHFIAELAEGTITAANAAVSGNKCLQVCNGAIYTNHPAYETLHDAKVDALGSLIEELSGKPALIFYQYQHDLDRIIDRLGLDGATEIREDTVALFNRGVLPWLAVHPASAGHGLNLQEQANHVIWFGLPWSLELYDQAIRRVYRQGNPNTHVFVHHIVAADSIDQKVLRVLAGKERSQKALFAALLA